MRWLLSIISLISFAMGYSQVKSPDFAYPETTSKQAQQQLNAALASHNAESAINALIIRSISQSMIDGSTMTASIKLTDEVAAKFSDSALSGIFSLLEADMYASVYSSNRWVYDNRHLPLSPLPDDLTEWSGDMFRDKICSLANVAISDASISHLREMPIREYSQIIVADSLTSIYYPTLADFAYQKAADLMYNVQCDHRSDIYTQALDNSGSIASKIQWQTMLDGLDSEAYDRYLTTYNRYKGSVDAALVLVRMWDRVNNIEKRSAFLAFARDYMSHFPDSPFSPNIKSFIDSILRKQVTVDFPELCGLNASFKVNVKNENCNEYKINAYYIGETFDSRSSKKAISQIIDKGHPVSSVQVKCAEQTPFIKDGVEQLTFDRPGYYVIVPYIPNIKAADMAYQVVRCVPAIPTVVYGGGNDRAIVIATNPSSGAPMPGIKVKVLDRKDKVVHSASTDRYGIAHVELIKDRNRITLSVDGHDYEFNNAYIYYYKSEQKESTSNLANVLTDRAIYHPGDGVDVLGVFYTRHVGADGATDMHLTTTETVDFVLFDANYNRVDTISATTDEFGRATAHFTLPTDGLTGQFSVHAVIDGEDAGSRHFTVSDFRMPDFEVSVATIENDTPDKGDVTITGSAKAYSGMPMTDTAIELSLSECAFFWWRGGSNNYPFYTTKVDTDDRGNFSVVIPDSVFAENTADIYEIVLEAVSANGATASASQTFSRTKKYQITATFDGTNVNGEIPFEPSVEIYNAKGERCELALVWALKKPKSGASDVINDDCIEESIIDEADGSEVVAKGDYYGAIDLSKIRPGTYTLSLSAKDKNLANECSLNITVYNVESGIVPDNLPLWVKDDRIKASSGEMVNVDFAVGNDKSHVYYMLTNADEVITIELGEYAYGYHTIGIKLPDNPENANIALMTVHDCHTYTERVDLIIEAKRGLKIVGESFRDRLLPGSDETWRIKVVDAEGRPLSTALALDMYNKALDALHTQSFSMGFSKFGRYNDVNINTCYFYTNRNQMREKYTSYKTVWLQAPTFQMYGQGFYGYEKMMVKNLGRSMKVEASTMAINESMDLCEEEVSYDSAVVPAMAMGSGSDGSNDSATTEVIAVDYRESEVTMAIWAPMLTTDSEGSVEYTFTVPNANTTWRLQAVAWSQQMEVGSLMRDFVASKPVMVVPNLPRFLRTGDTATILASVQNNSDNASAITTVIEIFNPINQQVITQRSFTQNIDAMQQAIVSIDVEAMQGMEAIGYRVRSSNGDFADGEQAVIRILRDEQSLIETKPFYLNPGDKDYTTVLPADKDARITLTFCENPAWTIVTALPGLRTDVQEYANSAAAALYSAAIARGITDSNPEIARAIDLWRSNPSDSVLVSMLAKNEDLKIAVLNATPWVLAAQSDTERMANLAMIFDVKEVDKSIDGAMSILRKLQNSDGGWAWSKWCDQSSVWVTSNVLAMLGDLQRLSWLPNDKSLRQMIERAVKYYDKEVEDTDLLYTLIRPLFPNIAVSSNGKKVIANTISEIKKDWKHYSNPAYKSMAAEALWLNGETKKARELMGSVAEFGVYTPSQGLKFPSVNALYDYAILLEAFGMIEPGSKAVDGLRQQLIVRKEGTDWGSSVVTTEVVKSILSTGTKWTVDAIGAKVTVDGTEIVADNTIETATGNLRADLSIYGGKQLSITTSGEGPAYGALYAQFDQRMVDVKASACDDLDIEKQLYVRRGTDWTMWQTGDTLAVGDRVKVQLTIHCKRNLQYVSIIDERPATFEPVEQLPGWMWSEGVGFYRENRDSQTDLHVVYMSPGTYLLTYEMNVNLAGHFTSGIATIQSQYAPSLSAHSSGSAIIVK